MIKQTTAAILFALLLPACGAKTTEVYTSAPVPPRPTAAQEEVTVEFEDDRERPEADRPPPTKLKYNNILYEKFPVVR